MTRRLAVLLAVTALVFGAGAVYLTLRDGSLPSLIPPVEECQARAEGHLVELDLEQSRYAALITRDLGAARDARPGRHDRARHGVPGVRPPQPRVRRP